MEIFRPAHHIIHRTPTRRLRAVAALPLIVLLLCVHPQVASSGTQTTKFQLPASAQQWRSTPIWLSGPLWSGGCDPASGVTPVLVGLVWDESPGWLPVWELQLIVSESLVPAGLRLPNVPGPLPQTRRLTIAVARPEWGHSYDTTLGYDPPTGAVSIHVQNATTGERVHAGELRLVPYSSEVLSDSAWMDCVDPKPLPPYSGSTFIEGSYNSLYIPRGLTWNIVEEQADGRSFIPLGRIDRNATHRSGIQIKMLEAPPGAAIRLRLEAEDADSPLLLDWVYSDIGVQNFYTFDPAVLAPGHMQVILDYVVDGTVYFTERKSVQVGAVAFRFDRLASLRDPNRIGELVVETDGPFTDFPVMARVQVARLEWDGSMGRYKEEAQGETTLLDRRLDLTGAPLHLPLSIPDELLSEPGLWRFELSMTGGSDRIIPPPVKQEFLHATYPQPLIEPGQPFTIAVLPDTQYYSFESPQGGNPDMFLRQTHWLAEMAAEQNIALMLHVGDITEHNRVDEWLVARQSIRVLDGIIPYALAVGNHDIGPAGTRGTGFNTYFPLQNYASLPSFGGVFMPGQMENSYHTFRIAEMDFLVVVLEFWPRDAVVAWANEVVVSHPEHATIVLTHTYTGSDGRRRASGYEYSVGQGTGDGLNTGADLWEKFIRKHPNIMLVLSGHVPHSAVPRDIGIGDFGNAVYEILMDFQFDPNGGNGWLGLLHFPAERDRIDVTVYSPYLDEEKHDAKGGFYVPFTIDLNDTMYRTVVSHRSSW